MKKLVTYTLGLIGLYLVVEHGTDSGNVIKAGANGGATVIKSLQGRG